MSQVTGRRYNSEEERQIYYKQIDAQLDDNELNPEYAKWKKENQGICETIRDIWNDVIKDIRTTTQPLRAVKWAVLPIAIIVFGAIGLVLLPFYLMNKLLSVEERNYQSFGPGGYESDSGYSSEED